MIAVGYVISDVTSCFDHVDYCYLAAGYVQLAAESYQTYTAMALAAVHGDLG